MGYLLFDRIDNLSNRFVMIGNRLVMRPLNEINDTILFLSYDNFRPSIRDLTGLSVM